MPSHYHLSYIANSSGYQLSENMIYFNSSTYTWHDPNTAAVTVGEVFASSSKGGSQSHNNIQPYITVYMWKRTA